MSDKMINENKILQNDCHKQIAQKHGCQWKLKFIAKRNGQFSCAFGWFDCLSFVKSGCDFSSSAINRWKMNGQKMKSN